LGEWNTVSGSAATEHKVYCAKGIRYYSKLGVAEFKIEASELTVGDRILITGNSTGAMYCDVQEIRYDLKPVEKGLKGQHISIPVPRKIRPKDKLYIIRQDI
jgi:putative protease